MPMIEQYSLPGFCALAEAVHALAHDSTADERGAVFTKRAVVDFLLDLAG